MTAKFVLILLVVTPALACADTIYISNEQDNTVSVIDSTSLGAAATIPVGRRPRGIALDRNRNRLYIAVGDDDRIDVLDLKTQEVVESLPCGEDPEFFALHPDGKRVFVANENDNLISVLDLNAKK